MPSHGAVRGESPLERFVAATSLRIVEVRHLDLVVLVAPVQGYGPRFHLPTIPLYPKTQTERRATARRPEVGYRATLRVAWIAYVQIFENTEITGP
jgi:hypothetical protein